MISKWIYFLLLTALSMVSALSGASSEIFILRRRIKFLEAALAKCQETCSSLPKEEDPQVITNDFIGLSEKMTNARTITVSAIKSSMYDSQISRPHRTLIQLSYFSVNDSLIYGAITSDLSMVQKALINGA